MTQRTDDECTCFAEYTADSSTLPVCICEKRKPSPTTSGDEELVDRWYEEFNSLKDSLGEVPENTCPNIDKALNELGRLEKDFSYMQRNVSHYEDVEAFAKDLPDVGWLDTPEILEELRADNEQLRELGRRWYQFSKELLAAFEVQNQQIAAAKAEERENFKNLLEAHLDRDNWTGTQVVKCLLMDIEDGYDEEIIKEHKDTLTNQ